MKFIYKTNLYAPLISLSIALYTSYVFRVDVGSVFFLFLFFATYFVYLGDRVLFDETADIINAPIRSEYLFHFEIFSLFLLFVSSLICILSFLYLKRSVQVLILAVSCTGVLYFILHQAGRSGFYIFSRNKLNFSKMAISGKFKLISAVLKPFLLSLVWTGACVVMPLMESSGEIDSNVFLYSGGFFMVFLYNALCFDYKDLSGDTKEKKPNIFSFVSGKIFFISLIFISAVSFFIFYFSGKGLFILMLPVYYFLFSIYSTFDFFQFHFKKNELFYFLWIDLPLGLIPLFGWISGKLFLIVALRVFPD